LNGEVVIAERSDGRIYFAVEPTAGSMVCTAPALRTGSVAVSSPYTFCPAVDMIEQLGRGALRPHQRRFDFVFLKQPEQMFRLLQSNRDLPHRVGIEPRDRTTRSKHPRA
jgi:hypothetical protein